MILEFSFSKLKVLLGLLTLDHIYFYKVWDYSTCSGPYWIISLSYIENEFCRLSHIIVLILIDSKEQKLFSPAAVMFAISMIEFVALYSRVN